MTLTLELADHLAKAMSKPRSVERGLDLDDLVIRALECDFTPLHALPSEHLRRLEELDDLRHASVYP